MFFRILKKDLRRKRTMNVILALFVILATMFLASSVSNLIAVNGAVDYFMEISKVPDYFTLALTDGTEDAVADYLKNSSDVAEFEVIETFNVTNEPISVLQADDEKAGKYERTNTLAVQAVPENFMRVFDREGNPLRLKSGEIAFPKVEAEANHLDIGDKLSIRIGEVEQEFTIAAITKDVVFGSPMMGYKRLFITLEDYEKFAAQQDLTYTNIYCVNYADKGAFRADWKQQDFNLITNVEKSLVSMCYIMDMLMAGVLIIVSVCLIVIAFLVLRFTIIFTLQEDYREIGIMKAIGMKEAGIRGIYMIKYFGLSILGATVGLLLSFPFSEMLLGQAIVNLVVEDARGNYLVHVICATGIVGIVLAFCYSSTRKLRRFSAIDAIRNGSTGERYQAKNPLKLWKRKRMNPRFYMACNDILSAPKRFAVLLITFCIGTMMILIPLSALHTLRSDEIIGMFSMVPSDVYIDMGHGDDYVAGKKVEVIQADLDELEETMHAHGIEAKTGADVGYMIPCYADDPEELYNYMILQEMGSWDRSYELLDGREPVFANELMITERTAEEMGVSIGDSVYFQYPDTAEEYVVTGTYQSMMNMGNGYRVSRAATLREEYITGVFTLQAEAVNLESVEAYEQIKDLFPDYKVMDAGECVDGMIGDITDQMDILLYVITGIVLLINSLITVLMMKTMMARERGDIALLKSIGFRNGALRSWQMSRILMLLVAAILLGTVLSKLLGPVTVGQVFDMMGATQVKLYVNPVEAYLVYPLLLLAVTGGAAFLCAGGVANVDVKEVNVE
ncbi:MAG: ABC transporter permease [Roseburia sp.]